VIRTESHPWTSWSRWSEAWTDVHAACPERSFFLSPEWVEAWLEVFGARLRPEIVVFSEEGRRGSPVVGLCLLVGRLERVGLFRLRRLYLNTAGEDERDEAYLEDNAVLCRPGSEEGVARALAELLAARRWDELFLHGMSPSRTLDALETTSLGRPAASRDVPSPFVDLGALGDEPDGYLKALSRNTREQVRRSQRQLEKIGPLRIEAAATEADARQALDELARLHTASWTARGRPGVFVSRSFRDFHERLIGKAFGSGRIQLLRSLAGAETLAVLYNFVHEETAFFYQSGLRLVGDKRTKVGLAAHALAVEHCRRAGLRRYDFLAGDDQYKRSLSTGSRTLRWLVFRRASPRLRALGLLRQARRAFKGRTGAGC
jgi:CelD/BcsL family acetyltransferase involved in cellulose biosynthesis